MIFLIIATVFVVASASILYYRWQHRRFYSLYSKIPIVPGHLPLIGVGYRFMTSSNELIFKAILDLTRPGPSPRRACSGPLCFAIIDDVEQIEKVFTSKYIINKSFLSKKFIMKTGLLVDDGARWRLHRRLLEPSFNTTIVKSFTHIFHEKAMICMDQLEQKVGKPSFEIAHIWQALALENILSTSSGLERDVQRKSNDTYLRSVIVSLKVFSAKMMQPVYQIDWLFRLSKLYKLEQEHAVNGFMTMGDAVIEEKRKNLTKPIETPSTDDIKLNKPQIFIDQIFKMTDKLTIDDIRDEINTIIIAGFETMGTTLSMITVLMSLYPDVQEKLHEELRSVFESEDEQVTDQHLKKCVYLEKVIKESLRYWPAIAFIGRGLHQDIELGGYTIPSGTNLGIPSMRIHRNKKYWGEDAEEFKPERFTPDIFDRVPLYAYLPFSRGPRNCIGYNYAMYSLKIVLAHFFRRFRSFTTFKEEELTFEFLVVMRIVQGSWVTIKRREFISTKSEETLRK